MRKVLRPLAMVAATILSRPAMAEDALEPSFAPVGRWAIDYEQDRCTLSRNFQLGDSSVRIKLTQSFEPLAITVGVDGDGETLLRGADRARLVSGANAVDTRVLVYMSERPQPRLPVSGSFAGLAAFRSSDEVPTLTFYDGARPLESVDMSGLSVGLGALRTCQADLYRSIGADADALQSIVTDAEPAGSPATWVRPDDVPPVLANNSQPLTVSMRLEISAEGRVRQCTVVTSSGEPALDAYSCRILVVRARYRPARDAQGNPVMTFKTRGIRWPGRG